jgi:hypothetical protein
MLHLDRRMVIRPGRLPCLPLVLMIALSALWPATGSAQQGMPDDRPMSGVPLPVGDVPVGTVTVRVIRGSLANIVPGQDVELVVAGAPRASKTNEAGRAEFSGLTPGSQVKARTTVDGQTLESQTFAVPSAGGVRLMLVAAPPGEAAGSAGPTTATGPVQAGSVSLGDQTRFVYEMADESLTGFYILQLVNAGPSPVQPTSPFQLDLPEGAEAATMMQGSSPQATVANGKVLVAGPFAPGQTQVQVAFTMPYDSRDREITQRLPVPLAALTVLVEKVGGMQMSSPQIAQSREVQAQGDTYMLGQGSGIPAGGVITLRLSGLPHHAVWPRNLALCLAVIILVGGVWLAARPGPVVNAEAERRRKLRARRDRLFSDLADVESRRRATSIADEQYEAQRAKLVQALERIYAELDTDAAA